MHHGGERGQFVLLAGVVVAVALIAMLTAYLQLGYHADVASTGEDRAVLDATSFLERNTHEAARQIRGEYEWGRRARAVTAVRDRLRPRLETLQRSRVREGIVYHGAFNQTTAVDWAGSNCPDGPERQFGRCEADRGVVVQERSGRTLVLAVAYDLEVTSDERSTSLRTVANATE